MEPVYTLSLDNYRAQQDDFLQEILDDLASSSGEQKINKNRLEINNVSYFILIIYIDFSDTTEGLSSNSAEDSDSFSSWSTLSSRKNVAKSRHVAKSSAIPTSTKKLLSILNKMEKQSELKLYSYVSYDRADSLIYLPSNMARFTTSANVHGLSKMLKQHCHKHCGITISELWKPFNPKEGEPTMCVTSHNAITVPYYVDMFAITRELHPDSICSQQSTEVIGNTIQGTQYYQYTDVPEMYQFADSFITDPAFKQMFTGDRKAILGHRLHLQAQSEAVRSAIYALIDAQQSLSVHACTKFIITYNNRRKITDLQFLTLHTGVTHNNVHFAL